MSLYLCVFDEDVELEGVEVGPYADFNRLRRFVAAELEGDRAGSRFPVLMNHADSEGEWTAPDCLALRGELLAIREELEGRPPVAGPAGTPEEGARNAFESFLDVDGAFLIARLQGLVETALRHRRPILFQ